MCRNQWPLHRYRLNAPHVPGQLGPILSLTSFEERDWLPIATAGCDGKYDVKRLVQSENM